MRVGGEVRQSVLWSLQVSKGKPSTSGGSNVLAEPESGGTAALPCVPAARTSALRVPLPRCTPTWKGDTSLLLSCLPPPRALRGALPTQRIPPLSLSYHREPNRQVPSCLSSSTVHPSQTPHCKGLAGPSSPGFSRPHPLSCAERKGGEEKNGRAGTCGRKRGEKTTMYFWGLTHMQTLCDLSLVIRGHHWTSHYAKAT